MSEENNELAGMYQGSGSESLPNAQAEDEIGGFFGSLDVGDLIEINRLAPIEHRGWLTALPFDPSIDIHSEIKRRYGGGTYSLKRRGRSRTGSVQWKRGSATITIAGEPILPAPVVVAPMPWQQPAQPMPWQQPPQASVDLQGRLLDILSSKLETPAQNLGEIIREIQQIIPMGAAKPPGNAIDDLVSSVRAARQLQELLASPAPAVNPADDDDDDEGDTNKIMKMLGMKILADMMGSKTAAAPLAAAARPNPVPRMPPPRMPPRTYDDPPGWRKNEAGQWERTFDPSDCPPGWTRDSHTGQFRPVEVSMRDQRMDTGRFGPTTSPPAPAFNGHPDDFEPANVPLSGESGTLLQGDEESGTTELETGDGEAEGPELTPEELADEILAMDESEQLRVWQALQASGKLKL